MDSKKMIAQTGSHGTGKTTATGIHFNTHKRDYPERSAQVICNQEGFCPFPINKDTTEKAQIWIFSNQIKREMEALHRFDVVFTDRTIIDIIAYTQVAGFSFLAEGMLAFAETHIQYYSQIYFKKIAHNQHCYPDGLRDADDLAFRQKVEDTMLDLYHQLVTADLLPGRVIRYV